MEGKQRSSSVASSVVDGSNRVILFAAKSRNWKSRKGCCVLSLISAGMDGVSQVRLRLQRAACSDFCVFRQGLLKFCLSLDDGQGLKQFGDRPKEDWEWLKAALESFEHPAKKVQRLVEELKEVSVTSDEDKILYCLQELNEEIIDVDQAQVVANLGGISTLLALSRHSNKQIRLEALTAVQASLKNNEPLQEQAKRLGALPFLLQILVNVNEDVIVRSRALSAASALSEHKPELQDAFVRSGGLVMASDLVGPQADLRTAFRAAFVLKWLLMNRSDFKDEFLKCEKFVDGLRLRAAAAEDSDAKEIAAEFLELLK